MNRKRHRNNNAATKLEAIDWAKKNSIHSAAKKFRVERSCIKDWIKNEIKLERQTSANILIVPEN